jgi:glutamate-5-semialdehyde dehydrogenase
MTIQQMASLAKAAAIPMAALRGDHKNSALSHIMTALESHRDDIAAANEIDLNEARTNGLAAPLVKRLRFDGGKIEESCTGLASLIALGDPIGLTLTATQLDQGLELFKVSRPIGVIGVIFESRPDALVQIASLCLKSGNAVLLKGGSEAAHTNRILARIVAEAGAAAGLPQGWIGLLTTREEISAMLALEEYIDLIVPRGSNDFVRYIMAHTQIPVLGHADGICHVYLDRDAEPEMAKRVTVDSKCQYAAVCNAAETLLIHQDRADLLPALQHALEAKNVEIRGCDLTRAKIDVLSATEADWRTEYLDLIISIKIVPSLEAAVAHINRYGSGHTDVIVTTQRERAVYFMDRVDSADVFWNCSSRFSDGYRFGLGAEVGISTNKIHARGPVGLEGLTIYQWRLMGRGQIVADYSGSNARTFRHRKLDKTFGS